MRKIATVLALTLSVLTLVGCASKSASDMNTDTVAPAHHDLKGEVGKK